LVLNLVKLAGVALPCLIVKMITSFSARVKIVLLKLLKNEYLKYIFVQQVLCNSQMVRV